MDSISSGCTCSSDINQQSSMHAIEGTDYTIPCNHNTLATNELIAWYRQIHDGGPQYLISHHKTTENNALSKYSIEFNKDRKSSQLNIKNIKLEESGIYLCAKAATVMQTSSLSVQYLMPSSGAGLQGHSFLFFHAFCGDYFINHELQMQPLCFFVFDTE
ncbi:hypothetical protein XELAEV_18007236mg [Xenopus laevis]|uniref:Ig-like domain-containing protein n=1 Tax=Xenopus laevis TaxID=8355 RepID=A0A974I562_XENLA|nr:hypothetical protein XELAEV_18007236mg [Xenopus laevis]